MSHESPITSLLAAWKKGDQSALDQLMPLIYSNLHRMAKATLRREHGIRTIDPTVLVHEAYLRMVADPDPDFENRAHFLGVAARLMRQILVDRARTRNAAKRTGGIRIPLDDDILSAGQHDTLVVALNDALSDLERQDPEKAKLLELRYFGGLTAEESAELMGVSVHKINRQMGLAQAWLRRQLDGSSRVDSSA